MCKQNSESKCIDGLHLRKKLNLILCFVIKTEILPIIRGFVANTKDQKHKAADETLEQHFLKEFKATWKNPGESELKQQKAI